MGSTSVVRVRIDERLKNEAAKVLAEFGLSVSDVVRMALARVVKTGAVPLELKIPNAETAAAMQESRALMKKHKAKNGGARGRVRRP